MLQRAVEILGGPCEVAEYLGVSPGWVRIWMRGMFSLPDDVFLKLVDLLSALPGGASEQRRGKRPG
jgi:hypothetical protein